MRKSFVLPPCPDPGQTFLPLAPDAPWLAPLAGYSDLPFRLLCREYGAAVCETEMISAKGLAYRSPGTGELLASLQADQPLVVQLFGADAALMGAAVSRLRALGYRWFDCNMGCSVPKVMRQGAGAALLGDSEAALAVARAMVAAARADEPCPLSPPVAATPTLPDGTGASAGITGITGISGVAGVGFKLRLGLDTARPALPDLALRLEDLGAAWLTVHPRTARQGFGGHADWDCLARLRGRLSIPLIASGDLFSAEDGLRCLAATGVNAVMYARGAMHDPAIFTAHRALMADFAAGTAALRSAASGTAASGMALPDAPVSGHAALRAMIERHVALARAHGGDGAALFKMRSVVPRYVRALPGSRALRQRLCRCTHWQELEALLDEFLAADTGRT